MQLGRGQLGEASALCLRAGGESSSKAAALSPSSGRTAPMKQRKTLSTLGGRKVSTSADASKGAKNSSESGPAQVSPASVAPPDGI